MLFPLSLFMDGNCWVRCYYVLPKMSSYASPPNIFYFPFAPALRRHPFATAPFVEFAFRGIQDKLILQCR